MKADGPLVARLVPSPNFGDRRGKAIDALVLHYTGMGTGARALARLCDPKSEVSCHYLVWEDGMIDQLVAECDRAWHAGPSFWAGERDMNSRSIGIEIVNAGHDGGCLPYPKAQIDAVIALSRDCCARHAIHRHRVLAHSDIAPARKIDPGEWFPWGRLAAEGVGLLVEPAAIDDSPILRKGAAGPEVARLHEDLARLGFEAPRTGDYGEETALIVAAFQRHYRPARVDGEADGSTRLTLVALLRALA